MLALIAGTGDLPPALLARLTVRPLVCALEGFAPAVPADLTFRIETLGSLMEDLASRGVTQVCLAGAIRRPPVDAAAIDGATAPLVPRIERALAAGDDGALRIVMALFEERGLRIVAAHEIAPDLLPRAGVLTAAQPGSAHADDARIGALEVARLGASDTGQACVVAGGRVVASEGAAGTDAMLAGLAGQDGILFKAPKPDQDRRADLPVIGPGTARAAAAVGLDGIVIAAGGVMVLEREAVVSICDDAGLFLWVRETP